jgi:N-acetylneuraminic acid mutarotase
MSFSKIDTKGQIPSERAQCSIAMVDSSIYLFGGTCFGEANQEHWMINTKDWFWKKLEPKGKLPCVRWGHSATTIGKKIFIFGGETIGSKKLNDLFIFDTETLEWSQPEKMSGVSPAPRSCHSATLANNIKLIIYGGEGFNESSQSFVVLNTETMTWSIPPLQGEPELRKGHVSVLYKNKFIVFY